VRGGVEGVWDKSLLFGKVFGVVFDDLDDILRG
jgi:hypothetical protein